MQIGKLARLLLTGSESRKQGYCGQCCQFGNMVLSRLLSVDDVHATSPAAEKDQSDQEEEQDAPQDDEQCVGRLASYREK